MFHWGPALDLSSTVAWRARRMKIRNAIEELPVCCLAFKWLHPVNQHDIVEFTFFSAVIIDALSCDVLVLSQCVRVLHHCAAGLLSWPAPPREDRPERCTWPCAHDDPSCSEPAAGARQTKWEESKISEAIHLKKTSIIVPCLQSSSEWLYLYQQKRCNAIVFGNEGGDGHFNWLQHVWNAESVKTNGPWNEAKQSTGRENVAASLYKSAILTMQHGGKKRDKVNFPNARGLSVYIHHWGPPGLWPPCAAQGCRCMGRTWSCLHSSPQYRVSTTAREQQMCIIIQIKCTLCKQIQ